MKKTIIALTLAITANVANANSDNEQLIYAWGGAQVRTDAYGLMYRAIIALPTSGGSKQGMYFDVISLEGSKELACDVNEHFRKQGNGVMQRDSYWNINGKNVQMTEMCFRNGSVMIANVITKTGMDYIVSQFEKADNEEPKIGTKEGFVEIKPRFGNSISYYGGGFIKEWNNFGGDAI